MAEWGGRLIQVTWRSNVGFVYDLASFDLLDTFHYPGEGWGLTHDGTRLIMSDGSDTLRFLDPESFNQGGCISVRDGSVSVRDLNELEYVRGEIYANVWRKNRIARISLESGGLLVWIDLASVLPSVYRFDHPDAVLNGIAFDGKDNRLFVTGKLWPRLFEIRLVPR